MDLCGCKYSSHHIEGISQVLPTSTATSNPKKIFQRFLSTIQPSNSSSSEGEEVVDSNMALSEKHQNGVDKCNEFEKCSNGERNEQFAKELAVFESTKQKTNNVSKLHEALKSVPPTSVEAGPEKGQENDLHNLNHLNNNNK